MQNFPRSELEALGGDRTCESRFPGLEVEALPGVVSSGMSKEYVRRENLGVWSLTSLTVMFNLMSDDCLPSSARTSREYLERRSRSSFLVAIKSPDSGSMRKLSSAPLMMV